MLYIAAQCTAESINPRRVSKNHSISMVTDKIRERERENRFLWAPTNTHTQVTQNVNLYRHKLHEYMSLGSTVHNIPQNGESVIKINHKGEEKVKGKMKWKAVHSSRESHSHTAQQQNTLHYRGASILIPCIKADLSTQWPNEWTWLWTQSTKITQWPRVLSMWERHMY